MAYESDQSEYPLPANGEGSRASETLLPKYFRSEVNRKFLQSTLDQLTQPGVAEKLNGYFGREISKAYNVNDNYIGDTSESRKNYQFEPAVLIKDNLNNVTFFKDYNDYLNQIKNFGGNIDNQEILNSQEFYAWNPNIDWDKFTNFREYFWLPYGPLTIRIAGQSRGIESTISVSLADNIDNRSFIFSSDSLVQNPTLILYRGQKYTFEIDSLGTPFSIRTARTLDSGFNYEDGISAQGVERGTIVFEVGSGAPEALYYVADNDINNSGLIQIKDILENTEIDVEKEIIGKVRYKTENGVDLSNGMKISFAGLVTPEKYATGDWYVEGVGTSITLISEKDMEIPGPYSENRDVPFDNSPFDRLPYDNANGYPGEKDYIIINRASPDRNAWSRYNRWFHRSVIEKAAEVNGQLANVDQAQRATRPIIEFNSGLKLYNYGTKSKVNVDLVDTFTTDIFSTVEGAVGYNVDGVQLVSGMRVLFAAETDILYSGKIFKIKFITHKGRRQISLVEEDDSTPLLNETVLVLNGQENQGKTFYFDGNRWNLAQEKTKRNQQPLFDLFDAEGNSYSDSSVYTNTTFSGNMIFSYGVGIGPVDAELGFPLRYRSIENIGDLVFSFDLLSKTFTYTELDSTRTQSTGNCFLKRFIDRDLSTDVNGWTKANTESTQRVLRQYVALEGQTDFVIDVYDNSAELTDVSVRVSVNNFLKFNVSDYTVISINNNKVVRFNSPLSANDIVVFKTRSKAAKNQNGIYEVPGNLERNPKNNDITIFTLGEVNDHVSTIVQEAEEFIGEFPGRGNLRDIGNSSQYGRKFLQHSGPINLALYHLTIKDANIVKAIDYSRREYSKFKRLFLQTALDLGFDGSPKDHVDLIFKELNRNKNINLPFYFSGMVPTGGAKRLQYDIFEEGNQFYALSNPYNPREISIKAVTVYVNDSQLIFEKDYTFNDEGFCVITYPLVRGDRVEIFEYETTDGSYVPPTPTKLGLYPKFIPSKFIDNTYQTPTEVIQGHDGSIIKAFGDYRDNLILELEKRIYNNIKIDYDRNIINIQSFVGGEYRDTGISKENIDASMIKDFAGWLNIVGDVDYTDFSFYERSNSFTYNYSRMQSPSGKPLPGFWRAIYKQAYDTDRPHTHPWEMLGFTIQPDWWSEVYGPAPYTSNNLIMWEDIEKGIIAEPGKARIVLDAYKRPGLSSHLPVDTQGNLLSPLDSRYAQNYVNAFTRNPFKFGDESPVETAWRKSSEYPFSIMKAWILNQPSKIIGLAFDRQRIQRNSAGQLVYSETGKRLRLEDLVFPNNSSSTSRATSIRTFSSGFVNFIANYLASNILVNYESYKENLKSVTNQMAFKVGGFTDKTKFNLILDSRTPLNQGNVFVPEENYNIILQTSSPIDILTYSGVIVEKATSGYIIRGYDISNPAFTYYRYAQSEKDPTFNVGGISETFIEWDRNQRYIKEVIVRYNNLFYRTNVTHVSTDSFDESKFVKLPKLPQQGGKSAIFRKSFDKSSTETLAYGTLLRTSQEVVDFLLGYGAYLEDKGFVFDNYNSVIDTIENWKLSAREFLFWTTQNWDAGSLIALSPSAQRVEYNGTDSVVDDIFDTFYDYGLVKADGTKIRKEFCNIARTSDNRFILTLKNTADGIYSLKLPIVQKEHVVILDNETAFKDVIYDPEPGYRQERIRVLGYRTADWQGGLNIPGFIYDQAIVTEWTPWKDYAIGEVVKYKEFFYTATRKVTGSEIFDSNQWFRLNEKPEPGLLTNLEYKINQFADFYDLDTDNFDVGQQEVAQHLIGYQKREYLANIINDDVSQYKFYQGFIADKGTKNALTKLFDALGSADKESLEFYEEWAVRLGQYGASDGFEEIEFLLDEEQFRLSPQPILLTNTIPDDVTDLIYRQLPDNVFLTPQNYNHAPFPTKYVSDTALKTAGYVRTDDVQFTVKNKEDILELSIDEVKQGDYVWVTFEGQEWNVYKHIDTGFTITSAVPSGDQAILTLDKLSNFNVGDIIGVKGIDDISGFHKVAASELNKVTIDLKDPPLSEELTGLSGIVTKFTSNRVLDLNQANQYAERNIDPGEVIWVDSIDSENRWAVIKAEESFNLAEDIINPAINNISFGSSIATSNLGDYVAVGSPDEGTGKVYIYRREKDGSTAYGTMQLRQTLVPTTGFSTGSSKYGSSLTMSPDGKFLIVGAPEASRVKSAYKEDFNLTTTYPRGSIVQYNGGLYRSRRTVRGQANNIVFGTFDNASRWRSELYKLYGTYEDIPLIVTGDFPLTDTTTDHILVRAPADAFEGSNSGDKLYLDWNDLSYNYTPISQIEIVNIELTNPLKITTDLAHGLIDGDEVIITDVPNDNLIVITDPYDNSDPIFPIDSPIREQLGVKGLENLKFFAKILGNDYIALYYDEELTDPVIGAIGFDGAAIPNGAFNGYLRKINKPFNNQHADVGIDKDFLVNTVHTIRRKVEEVFFVLDPLNIPSVAAGDRVTTETGNATVVYVKNELGRLVIYANSRNGVFDPTGTLFINDTFLVGNYTRPLHDSVDRGSVLGGFWEIATPQAYNPNGITTDFAEGLVIQDVKNNYNPINFTSPDPLWSESAARLPYKNSLQNDLDNPVTVLVATGKPFKKESNAIRNLSHVSQGISGSSALTNVLDNRWLVRLPKNVSDKAAADINAGKNPYVGVWLNDIPGPDGTALNLSNKGFGNDPWSIINGVRIPIDLWDGWIDYDRTGADLEIGDRIREGNNGAEATVAYYQRDLDKVRIYVKDVTGTFSFGSRYIEPPVPASMTINRVVGPILTPIGVLESRQLADSSIGKLAVFQHTSTLPIPPTLNFPFSTTTPDEIAKFETDFIRDLEYHTWIEEFKPGLPRSASIPSTSNNDWAEVLNIPIDVTRPESTFTREGAFFVYRLNTESQNYDLVNGFILPNREENRQLGKSLKIIQDKNFYKLAINSDESHSNDAGTGKGRIYFVLNGTDETGTYDWTIGRDSNFKGLYSNTTDYYENQVVVYNNIFYRALTNLQAEEFDPVKWKLLGEHIDYVGYLPNTTNLAIERPDDSSIDDLDTADFGNVFDISDNGNILATIAEYDYGNKLVIYRLRDRHFELVQEIFEPEDSRAFGVSVSVSDDGSLVAVGAPDTDSAQEFQGRIYVYKNVNGIFQLSQTLESPNSEQTEGFGSTLGFDGNQLVVTSIRGDIILDTTFDRFLERNPNSTQLFSSKYVNDPLSGLSPEETVLDRGFTRFTKRIQDSGVVFIYEKLNDSLVYGQRLDYTDFSVVNFGKNIIVKNNNIFVGLPTINVQQTIQGKVAVYTKPENSRTWTISRSPIDQIDVSKFRGSFVYDTKLNQMLSRLDILDPIAGKISGIAEQELKYKTYYDPATYNIGSQAVKDQYTAWGEKQIGQLWWDLSTVKYVNYYQETLTYAQSVWNDLAEGASIDVYEWVESRVIPSRWDSQADTNSGLALGYSGKSKYGDSKYVVKQVYDPVSQSFSQRYYFWVKNKKILPQVEFRKRTSFDVENIIRDPQSQGLRFVTILGNDRFVLYNCNSLVKEKDVAVNFRYWTIDNQENNIHTEYQIITDGLATSKPKRTIEEKWFDSLIGFDKYHRPVPDPMLSVKQKYGNLNRPRQSWFVNRQEALKEVIERVNRVLSSELVIDNINIEKLFDKDPVPTLISGHYDVSIDTESELRFVGTVRAATAVLRPVVEDGTVISVTVVNGGRGYRVPPTIQINGTGENLELRPVLNNLGIITSVEVINGGTNYADNLTLTVRPLSVLVKNDSTVGGVWAIYGWNPTTRTWSKTDQQYYDVSKYWSYKDWYAEGFSELTAVDFLIDDLYQLNIIDDTIGDIIKISNVGSGGWILVQKIINIDTPDYSTGYRTIGRQNGTIEFSSKLYLDEGGSTELRKILETIKNDLLVDELEIEYNNLFFASLRYVFSEQNYVDWAFKTSFVKAKHNVGELIQKTTFQNDNLPSFEEYVKEVKPYKSKIREYLSSYDKLENTQSIVTDFDLSPVYDPELGEIVAPQVKIEDGILTGINFDATAYPARHWVDNFTYEIEAIQIDDGGSGFTDIPNITISGGGGSGAKAKAFVGSGSIKSIIITDPGSGYTTTPTLIIQGSQPNGGRRPKLSVILSNKKVRGTRIKQKFDRIWPKFENLVLPETETFVSSGTELKLNLKWPIDLTRSKIRVLFNGNDALSSEYSYNNETVSDTSRTYSYQRGFISLTQAQPVGTQIIVEYSKSYELLNAADRINLLYNPQTGQLGKDLGQLMDGIDYGGVEVRSFEFGQDLGWDTQPWYTASWDTYDESFEDETFYTDGSTTKFELSKPLESGAEYNIYVNGIRIDDPNYDGSTKTYVAEDGSTILALGNPNAIMKSVTTQSSNYIVETVNGVSKYFIQIENIQSWEELYDNRWYNPPSNDVVVVIRKSTSDGSFLPQGIGFDTVVEGGNLQYGTATGVKAEDIVVDGDGFITPTTSKGPEELVPGQVLDTLDIKVYDRAGSGGSLIATRNYEVSINQETEFDLAVLPHNINSVLIKRNGIILSDDDYTIDFANKTLTLNAQTVAGDKVNVYSMGGNGQDILDIDNFIGDGTTQIFVTNVVYRNNIGFYITIDGVRAEASLFETDSSYGQRKGLVAIQFVTPPPQNSFIYYALYNVENITGDAFSEVTVDKFTGDGSTSQFILSAPPARRLPLSHNIVVKVNNKILYPGYTEHFTVVPSREYPLDRSQFGPSTLSPDQVDVYLNGRKLILLQDYSWDFANTQVNLFDNVGVSGDDLEIFIPSTGEYSFAQDTQIDLAAVVGTFIVGETVTIGTGDSTEYVSTVKSYISGRLVISGVLPGLVEQVDADRTIPVVGAESGAVSNNIISIKFVEAGDTLLLNEVPLIGSTIEVFKFTKHDIQDIQLETKTNIIRTSLTPNTVDYFGIRRLNRGLIKLRQPALDTAYLWVVLNGEMLTPNVDFKLSKLNEYVEITRSLTDDDLVQIIHFAADKTNEKFGFRMFKDMLNRTHYKRLNKNKVYILADELKVTDKEIKLVNAEGITQPSTELNVPGVLFIEGERIEYFQVNGNVLSQLRRGTLGTGPRAVYPAGTELMDQSASESIPYTDEMITLVKLEDESTQIVLDWVPANGNALEGINEFEVFVGGRRLRKNAISSYRFQQVNASGELTTALINQNSPEGDEILPSEFTLTIEDNVAVVNLAQRPATNSRVLIVRKLGKKWQKFGEQLRYADNPIAEFIRGATTDLPK